MSASPLSLAFALIAFGATLAVLSIGAGAASCRSACQPEPRLEVHAPDVSSHQP